MKPTCCLPLRGGMKFIAVIDFLISLMALAGCSGAFIYFEVFNEELMKYFNNPPPELDTFINLRKLDSVVTRILLGFSLAYWTQKFVLGIILVTGAFKEKRSLLRIWIVWTLILLVFSVFSFLSVISLGVAEPYAIPFYVVAFLMREYTVWGVYALLKRLQFGKDAAFPPFATTSDKVTYKL